MNKSNIIFILKVYVFNWKIINYLSYAYILYFSAGHQFDLRSGYEKCKTEFEHN